MGGKGFVCWVRFVGKGTGESVGAGVGGRERRQ